MAILFSSNCDAGVPDNADGISKVMGGVRPSTPIEILRIIQSSLGASAVTDCRDRASKWVR
jgi:hypothetical protein